MIFSSKSLIFRSLLLSASLTGACTKLNSSDPETGNLQDQLIQLNLETQSLKDSLSLPLTQAESYNTSNARKLQQELTFTKEELLKKERLLLELEHQNSYLVKVDAKLREELVKQKTDFEKTRYNLNLAQRAAADKVNNLSTLADEKAQLEKSKLVLEHEKNKALDEIALLQQELERAGDKISEKTESETRLQQKLELSQADLKLTQESLERFFVEKKRWAIASKDQLDQLERENKRLDKEREHHLEIIKNLHKQKLELKQSNKGLQNYNTQLSTLSQEKQLQHQKEWLSTQQQNLTKQVKTLEERLQQAEEVNTKLNRTIATHIKIIKDQNENIYLTEEKNAELTKANTFLLATKENMTTENQQLRKYLQDLQSNYCKDLRNTLAQWMEEKNKLEEIIETEEFPLKKELSNYEALCAKLSDNRELNKSSIDKQKELISQLQQKHKILQSELRRHKKEISNRNAIILEEKKRVDPEVFKTLENKYNTLVQAIDEMEQENTLLQEKLEARDNELKATVNENSDLQSDLAQMKEHFRSVEQVLKQVEAEHRTELIELEDYYQKEWNLATASNEEKSKLLSQLQQKLRAIMLEKASGEELLKTTLSEKEILENCFKEITAELAEIKSKSVQKIMELENQLSSQSPDLLNNENFNKNQELISQLQALNDNLSRQLALSQLQHEKDISEMSKTIAQQKEKLQKTISQLNFNKENKNMLEVQLRLLEKEYDKKDFQIWQAQEAQHNFSLKIHNQNKEREQALSTELARCKSNLTQQLEELSHNYLQSQRNLKQCEKALQDSLQDQKEFYRANMSARREVSVLREALSILSDEQLASESSRTQLQKQLEKTRSKLEEVSKSNTLANKALLQSKEEIAQLSASLTGKDYQIDQVKKELVEECEKREASEIENTALQEELNISQTVIELLETDQKTFDDINLYNKILLQFTGKELLARSEQNSKLKVETKNYLTKVGLIDQDNLDTNQITRNWVEKEISQLAMNQLMQNSKHDISDQLEEFVSGPKFAKTVLGMLPPADSINKIVNNPKFLRNTSTSEKADMAARKSKDLQNINNAYKLLLTKRALSKPGKFENNNLNKHLWQQIKTTSAGYLEEPAIKKLSLNQIGEENTLIAKLSKELLAA